jgi:hypothetical protein
MTGRRLFVLIGAAFWLMVCRQVAAGDGKTAPTDAARPAEATAPVAPRPTEPPLPAGKCAQIKQRVERELAGARRCKADSECEAVAFDYAFAPCGTSVKTGAPLVKAVAGARLYRQRCNPVLQPVRCAHLPRPVCEHGRCALAPPAEK